LNIEYADGSTKTIHRDVSCWEQGNTSISISFETAKTVKKLILGSTYTPDADKNNNVWEAK
jgi:hypothetical protein